MEKKTVKLTNFVKIQEELNQLAEDYKVASSNNNIEKLEAIKGKYEDLKTLLRSNAYYFNKLDVYDVNNKINNEQDIVKKGHLEAKKAEKKVYKSNKSYISMVEKADTLDDYIEKNSQKKRNFVKKHFKPIAVGTVVVLLLGSLSACKFGKKKDQYGYEPSNKIIETTTEDNTIEETKEITTENLNDLIETNDNSIKLNPLEETTDTNTIDSKNNTTDKKDNVSYTNKNTGSVGTTGTSSTGKTTTTTKSLDPHTEQKEAATKKTTTTTTTIKQESVKEPEAVDYPTTIIDNTGKNTTEKTDYEYKEETIDINDGTDMPIDEPTTTEQPTTQETIIIEENEEYEDTYNGDVIDDTYGYVLSYRMI